MLQKFVPVLMIALICPIPAHAMPAPSASASKWKNVEEMDSVLQSPVCRAFTQAQFGPDIVELSMAFPKDGKLLPMISLRTKVPAPLVAVQIAKNVQESLYLLKAAPTNEEVNVYWYAPVNVARLERSIRDGSALTFVFDPKGAAPANISLSLIGSTNALNEIQKCLKTWKEPLDFYQLLNAQKDNLTPDLGDRSVTFLFQNVQGAFNAYLAGQGIAVELAALRKASAPLLQREGVAKNLFKNAQTAFTDADAKLKSANDQVAALTSKLADSKAALAALTLEKPLAQADLAAKTATYQPLKAQMVPYEKAISDDSANVKSIQGQISQNEGLISRNNKLIPQLEAESASLRRQIPGLQARVSNTQSDYEDADAKFRRYDVNSEFNARLFSDAQYNWAKNDFMSAGRDVDRARGDVWHEQMEVSNAQSRLNSCRVQPNNPPCSAEQYMLISAQGRLSQAESSLNSAQWRQSSAQGTMQSRESSIRSDVQNESDRLRRIRDSAESDYESASNALSSAQSRVADIRNTIPQLRAQIDRATALLPQLHDQLSSAQAILATAIDARNAFSTQIGFGSAEAAYLAAGQHLKDTLAGIAQRSKEIPQYSHDLAAVQKTVPALTKTFNVTQAELAKDTGNLSAIEAQLQPFHEQEAAKLAALDVDATKFKNSRAVYQDLLKLL